MSEFDFEADLQTLEDGIADMASNGVPNDDKYFLLYADVGSGEGKVITQPWMINEIPLMISDLVDDWKVQLEDLVEGAIQFWANQRSLDRSAQVIPLRQTTKDDDPDDDGAPPSAA